MTVSEIHCLGVHRRAQVPVFEEFVSVPTIVSILQGFCPPAQFSFLWPFFQSQGLVSVSCSATLFQEFLGNIR